MKWARKTVEAYLILKEYMIRGLTKNPDSCAGITRFPVGQRASGEVLIPAVEQKKSYVGTVRYRRFFY